MPEQDSGSLGNIEPQGDLGLALALADIADEITMSRFGAIDLAVTAKPDLTPVTDADQSVERVLRARLAATRPRDAMLGEEMGTTGPGTDPARQVADPRRIGRTWIVDPIDGTKSFVRRVPVWASLIALLEDGRPTVGVVSAPALGRRWWAAQGSGAWVRDAPGAEPRPLAVSDVRDLADASISYSSLTGWADRGLLDPFVRLLTTVWRSRAYGDFWSYMMVAEGAVDLAAEPELAIWDMAAVAVIVTEAGGTFTGLDGRPGIHGGAGAASNGHLHSQLIKALR
ncbi:MAG: histidinol phosphatase [Pseudonocardiales bacterium]|nr:histidinol phosphatase [Pseudonocardiales bacterium]